MMGRRRNPGNQLASTEPGEEANDHTDALPSALRDVEQAAEALETFLSMHAPHCAGYGRYIAVFASELSGRQITNTDLRTLRDRADQPFRGTLGSMHDVSFSGSLETDYQDLKGRLGRALDCVEAAVRAELGSDSRASSMMRPYPRYYAVNDRPVKVVELADGGADVLVLDWATGAFMPDRSYWEQLSATHKDFDQLTESEFDLRVGLVRQAVVEKHVTSSIVWERTADGEIPYRATVHGHGFTIRVNDFPDEPLYTLLVDGQEVADLEDWPAAWVKPNERDTPR